MTERLLFLPRRSLFLKTSGLACSLLGLMTAINASEKGFTDFGTLLLCMASGVPPLLFCLVCFPLLRRLGVVYPAAKGSLAWRWTLYLGVFLGLSLAGHVVRGVFIGWLVGWPTDTVAAVLGLFGPPPAVFFLLVWSEREAATRHYLAGEEAALDQEIEQLFLSREALELARSRRMNDMLAAFSDRYEPQVARVAQQLQGSLERARADMPVAASELDAPWQTLVDLGEREFRQLGRAMHPTMVRLGLRPAIQSLVAQYAPDLAVSLAVHPPSDEPFGSDQPPTTVLALYRIIEAALDNVVRHAGATQVDVEMTRPADGSLSVVIRDDGVGFEPGARRWGVGFSVIDSRVALANGTWRLETAPRAGTQIYVHIPSSGTQVLSEKPTPA